MPAAQKMPSSGIIFIPDEDNRHILPTREADCRGHYDFSGDDSLGKAGNGNFRRQGNVL
jgi:hypothetical protein